MKDKKEERKKRHKRIRARISGTSLRPRLSVFKSNRYLSAQLIDDESGTTLASVSEGTQKKEMRGKASEERMRLLGVGLAKKAKIKKIGAIVFDRGGFSYTGNIKKFAEVLRKEGLTF